LGIYPNPAGSQVRIEWSLPVQNGRLEIVNIAGERIPVTSNLGVGQTFFMLQVEALPDGIYVVKLMDSEMTRAVSRLVVTH
jgi:hypothetical protein